MKTPSGIKSRMLDDRNVRRLLEAGAKRISAN
jgi:hypothetical protein